VAGGYGAQREAERWERLVEALDQAGQGLEGGEFAPLEVGDLREETILALRRLVAAGVAGVQLGQSTVEQVRTGLEGLAEEADKAVTEFASASEEAQSGRTSMIEAQQCARELAKSAEGISKVAQEVRTAVGQASSTCREGVLGVRDAVQGMDRIRTQVEAIAERMDRLEEATSRIESVVRFIQDISRQTDLLALNAAIEAAGAGEGGERFAVVATQVRRLSERTAEATGEIAGLVAEVRKRIGETTMLTRSGTNAVERGAQEIQEAGGEFQSIFETVEESSDQVKEITYSTEQQEQGTGLMARSVTGVQGLVGDVHEGAERARKAAGDLQGLAGRMLELVGDEGGEAHRA